MSETEQLPAFAEACSKGHHLFGKVKYCPFCGVAVMQPDVPTAKADTAPSQPVAVMELAKSEIAAPIPVPALQSENIETAPAPIGAVPQPIVAPTPELEQPTHPEAEQQPQITSPAPPPPIESPKPRPVTPLPFLPVPPTGKKKSFPMWMVVTGGLIVALILMFGGNKSTAPERAVPEATRPVTDTASIPSQQPRNKSSNKKPQPSNTSEQWAPLPGVQIPNAAPSKQQAKPHQNETVTGLLDRARKSIAQGNYKLAEDQMVTCDSFDRGNKECQQVKQKAKRLDEELQDCARAEKNWVDDRCVDINGNL